MFLVYVNCLDLESPEESSIEEIDDSCKYSSYIYVHFNMCFTPSYNHQSSYIKVYFLPTKMPQKVIQFAVFSDCCSVTIQLHS